MHAHSRANLKKSGQPFRLPVPWLVHYAEDFLTCKNSLSVHWGILASNAADRPSTANRHSFPAFWSQLKQMLNY